MNEVLRRYEKVRTLPLLYSMELGNIRLLLLMRLL